MRWKQKKEWTFPLLAFGRDEWTRIWAPLNDNLRVKPPTPPFERSQGGVIDVKGGATLAKHRFALAYGKHKVGKIKKSRPLIRPFALVEMSGLEPPTPTLYQF